MSCGRETEHLPGTPLHRPARPATLRAHSPAAGADLVVLSDEIYSELRYEGAEHTSIATLPGMKERTIFLHGFSKAFAMTGFRIGYACAPQALTEAMMKIHQYSMLCAQWLNTSAGLQPLRLRRG